jgi:DNA-binding response OmpR family regulator
MKSILIADGDERIAHMFAEVFASHDWSVTWYSDGHRAGEDLGAAPTTTPCSWGIDSRAWTAWS